MFIVVYYKENLQHWLVDHAIYYQHGFPRTYAKGSNAYPLVLEYPKKPGGGYPRVYVAEGKHASYAYRAECNAGGTLGIDTCEQVNTKVRLYAGGNVDIGSRAVHTPGQDCWPSTNVNYIYYGEDREECYWTGNKFRGWIPTWVGGAVSDPYGPVLLDNGF